MSSHGVPRLTQQTERTPEARQKELREIETYQKLVEDVNTKVAACEFTPELLQQTAELLKRNPEYYSIWNHRRRIYTNEFGELQKSYDAGQITKDNQHSQILDIIQLDLQFLFPLLLKFPKCYWIWHHRLWLLQQSNILLPIDVSRKLWQEELGLVGKMLSRDNRNFHGWGYRRVVVENLESPVLNGQSMATEEFNYTKRMIETNLSNFSAWHNRSKLILRMLDEQKATDVERKAMLDDELKLIHEALFDPYDQSLWFYHQTLMCCLDPAQCSRTMAPNLSDEERLEYLSEEKNFILDVMEDATDCKWVYQALIDNALLAIKVNVNGTRSGTDLEDIKNWLAQLRKLDPLRNGRWDDLAKTLAV